MADAAASASRRRARSDDGSSGGNESEGSGEDLMSSRKGRMIAGSDDDSSEEEEDDPEEARLIAAGFIVDDDEDREESGDDAKERKRKRKRRKAKGRQRMEEEEGLDEDDLDLLAENSGVRRRKDVHRLKRFRRGSAEPAEAPAKSKDLSRIFDDDDEDAEMAPPRRTADYDDDDDEDDLPSAANALRAAAADRSRRDLAAQQAGVGGFQDEMEDFIDDDDDDSDMSSVSEDEREARRERKRQERRAAQVNRRTGKAQAADPTRAGIDQEAWEELNDIFGNGDDYAWAFKKGDREELRDLEEDDAEDEEGAAGVPVQYKDIFEPAAIKARMLTEEDTRIKQADIPERFQMLLPGADGQKLLERKLTSDELVSAAKWICPRISTRCVRDFIQPDGRYVELVGVWQSCVRQIVELVMNEHREAMYLYVHHGDEIELRPTPDSHVQLLNRRDLQGLVSACMRYKTLMARKEGLNNIFERLSASANVTSDHRKTFQQMMEQAESTEEVADVADWLGLAFGQRLRDAQALEAGLGEAGGEADEDGIAKGGRNKGFKRPTNISAYEHLQVTKAKAFAAQATMPSTHLAENYAASGEVCEHLWVDPSESPLELASQFQDSTVNTPEKTLEGAKRLCAEDVGRDPTIRREVRNLYRFFGLIDVVPTERGEGKIHDEHPYYNFKYLVGKPVPEFREAEANDMPPPNPVQYLLMLEAEEQLLVTLDIQVTPTQLSGFERHLGDMYQGGSSEASGENAALWAEFRSDIIKMALEMFLVPCGKAWVKEYLREECRDWLGRQCEQQLHRRIACRPYESVSMRARAANPQVKNSDMWTADDEDEDDEAAEDERRSWAVPKVLAVSHGLGNPNRDVTKAVFLDSRGQLVQNTTFDELSPPRRQIDTPSLDLDGRDLSEMTDRERETYHARLNFIDLLKRRRPDVVVVNGFSPRTVGLIALIRLMVERAVNELIEEEGVTEPQDIQELQIDIITAHDDVARIYQHSARAADEQPTLDILSRYCIGLARYAQSPLQEFATLSEDDLASIRYHAQQHLLPKDRLIIHLDNTLTAVVNEVTVDINRAVSDSYYGQMLKYVAGLGPRKANALTRAIITHLEGTVVSRDSLRRGAEESRLAQKDVEVLPPTVFHNAVAFLTIRGARKNDLQGRPDVLDATRIHPESYEYARFIAFDALRKTEEDREENEHPSAFCRELLRDDRRNESIQAIDLADYERLLIQQQQERGERTTRKLTLLGFIARELMDPAQENRGDFVQPTEDEIFTALTGETSDTLLGILNVTVLNVQQEHIIVRLDSGIEGTINGAYLRPHDDGYYEQQGMRAPRLRDLVKQMQTIKAQVIAVDKLSLRVELTAKPEHLEAAAATCGKSGGVAVRPDPKYYNEAAAQQAKERADTVRRRKTNMRNTRSIAHPNWKNFKAGQAEEYLAHPGLEIGSAVVRPSSNGKDHLAVTWKVAKGVYQHIDVTELDKENDYELGKSLRVGDMGTYSDLDELLVKHILPMAHMVQQLMQHEKFRESDEKLDQYLVSYTQANPQRSIYGFAIDRARPGYFSLAFKANRDAPIQRWPVKVLPNRYRLREADQLPDVAALCNSFKTQYVAEVTQRGGRTPGGIGGATPRAGLGTGMTPYGAGYGGATPGGGIGGATPGRYGAAAYGAGASTPGALRNPYAGMPGSVRATTGMTPNPYGQPGPSRTPNPYGQAPSRTPNPYGAPGSSRTPNPYATGRTPNPYAGNAYPQPAYPGGPPAPPGAPPGPPPGMPPPGMSRGYGAPPPGAPPPPPPPGPPPSMPTGPKIHPSRLAQNNGGGGAW